MIFIENGTHMIEYYRYAKRHMKIQSNRRTGDELDVRICRCSGSSRNFAKYNSVCFTDQERLYYDLINQFRWTQDGLWY